MLFGTKQKVGSTEKLAGSMTLGRVGKCQIFKIWGYILLSPVTDNVTHEQ